MPVLGRLVGRLAGRPAGCTGLLRLGRLAARRRCGLLTLGRLLRLAAGGSEALGKAAHGDYLLILKMRDRRSPSSSAWRPGPLGETGSPVKDAARLRTATLDGWLGDEVRIGTP